MTPKQLASDVREYYRRNKNIKITAELCGTSQEQVIDILGEDFKICKHHYSNGFIKNAIEPVLRKRVGISKRAKEIHIDSDVLGLWVEYHQIKSGKKVVPTPVITNEFKEDVLRFTKTRKSGVTIAMIAAHYGISATTVSNWTNCDSAKIRRRKKNENTDGAGLGHYADLHGNH